MTLADLDAVIEHVEDVAALTCLSRDRTEGARIHGDAMDLLARLRTWRENAVEGWVFLSGLDSANQDAHNFYDGSEPDDHDGRALLLLSPEPKP